MLLVKRKVRRRIKPGIYKDVWVIRPAKKEAYMLWRHCTGSKQLEIPYRSYLANKVDELLFMHGISMLETVVMT